jgi:hypothetical protein
VGSRHWRQLRARFSTVGKQACIAMFLSSCNKNQYRSSIFINLRSILHWFPHMNTRNMCYSSSTLVTDIDHRASTVAIEQEKNNKKRRKKKASQNFCRPSIFLCQSKRVRSALDTMNMSTHNPHTLLRRQSRHIPLHTLSNALRNRHTAMRASMTTNTYTNLQPRTAPSPPVPGNLLLVPKAQQLLDRRADCLLRSRILHHNVLD